MRIAYVNAHYKSNHTGGGHVHMEQFIANVIALGHEIWTYPGNKFPGVNTIPTDRINHIRTMRQMDALYVRIESGFPEVCKWTLPPRRWLYGFPLIVWEFNTIPPHLALRGVNIQQINKTITQFNHYGQGCDLAICMTENLATYVRQTFDIQRILIVPNASDPDLFRPDLPAVNRMDPFKNKFNIVWIGSGKEPWHDLEMIRDAAALVLEVDKSKSVAFHIIGPDLTGIMADMPENVYYWGAEYYQKLANWLSGMDVGLSLYSQGPAEVASPLKVFDYMASGLTVVSSPLPFMVELSSTLKQPELIVPYSDPQTLATTLIKLSEDRERVRQLGLAGRQLVIDQYNWRRAVKDTMDEMEIILKEKTR